MCAAVSEGEKPKGKSVDKSPRTRALIKQIVLAGLFFTIQKKNCDKFYDKLSRISWYSSWSSKLRRRRHRCISYEARLTALMEQITLLINYASKEKTKWEFNIGIAITYRVPSNLLLEKGFPQPVQTQHSLCHSFPTAFTKAPVTAFEHLGHLFAATWLKHASQYGTPF